MSFVDKDSMPTGAPLAGAASQSPGPLAGRRDVGASMSGNAAVPAGTGIAPPEAQPSTPAPSLATLLSQARLAQAQLAAQPLPIANHSGDFILKLFGG